MANRIGKILCFLLINFSFSIKPCFSDPRTFEAALICGNTTASTADRQQFIANFLATFDLISPLVNRQRYGNVVNGTGNNTVYTFGQCMRDLSANDCHLCFAQCKTQILRCFPFQLLTRAGRLFYDGCYLRYDDYDFFDESLTSVERTVCDRGNEFVGNQSLFRQNVEQLVGNLSLVGPRNNGFAVGSVNRGNLTVYGLGQCWEFVNQSGCASCLANSAKSIVSCSPKVEGRVLNSGCYMRYSLQKFYDNSTDPAPTGNGGGSNRLAVALASTFGSLALLLFVASILYLTRRRILKHRREKKQLGALLATINKSNLNFSYETLEKATDYFSDCNKLGVGGSGSVFKGILPDGRTVAIKRLLFNSSQWVDHFFNEVNLISGIHHKNLVRLLGCSITGPESLLVYEFVPNQSLHDYLFSKKKVRSLTWEERRKIILGTAEGLAYLHEESKLRIIHRDIKLSNILLDTDFMAKIADFGLARLFPQDQTHISTAIAGTLGYMAPEYVVHGKLSEKADVYSFGVLVIEVVTGRRNNSFYQNSTSILQMVWTLYGTGRVLETVDASLEGQFREDEASRLLQVGLLCAQASAELRPSMSSVVKMLTDMECEVPQPAQPPFLNTSSSSFDRPGIYFRQQDSHTQSSGNSMTESLVEPR